MKDMESVLDIGQMLQKKQVISPMKKIASHSIRDLRQRFLIENTSYILKKG
jgi:hypothetical protein